ncbi:hypothetical protein M4I21_00425 [Cellulophaga sp. 20_2_10]|uniref:hypothetical protein n=1 Tax=Cellulophaga sp. 20_2_10 TaxID=2942476 RepID=UPI00201AA3D4|nr:hypothetical protein [Cellulophaga sp. 20_2_10]MCL5244253.1 hypothetical protein [Cellulophaga sp. 20_2_10]
MKLINSINEVLNFGFTDNSLVIKFIDKTIKKGNTSFKAEGKLYDQLEKGYFFDIKKCLVNIYDLNFKKVISIEKRGVISVGIIDNLESILIRWEDEKENEYYTLYSKNTELITIPMFRGTILDQNYRLEYNSYKPTTIKAYNMLNENFLWEHCLNEEYNITSKIQKIRKTLLIIAYKQTNKFKKVTGLDLETGNVIWEHNFELPYHKNIIATLINPLDELCYGYYGNQYQKFNPLTGEIVLQKDIVISDDSNFNPSKNSIYDNKLWFVGGKGENLKFGAIDIHTSELIFIQDFPLENDEQFDVPVYHNEKLYLRGLHKNTLYIFTEELKKS